MLCEKKNTIICYQSLQKIHFESKLHFTLTLASNILKTTWVRMLNVGAVLDITGLIQNVLIV